MRLSQNKSKSMIVMMMVMLLLLLLGTAFWVGGSSTPMSGVVTAYVATYSSTKVVPKHPQHQQGEEEEHHHHQQQQQHQKEPATSSWAQMLALQDDENEESVGWFLDDDSSTSSFTATSTAASHHPPAVVRRPQSPFHPKRRRLAVHHHQPPHQQQKPDHHRQQQQQQNPQNNQYYYWHESSSSSGWPDSFLSQHHHQEQPTIFDWATELPRGRNGGWTLDDRHHDRNHNNDREEREESIGGVSSSSSSSPSGLLTPNVFDWATELPRGANGGFTGAWSLNGFGFSNTNSQNNNNNNGDDDDEEHGTAAAAAAHAHHQSQSPSPTENGTSTILEQNMFHWATDLPRGHDGGFTGAWTLNGFGFSGGKKAEDNGCGSSSLNSFVHSSSFASSSNATTATTSSSCSMLTPNMFNWATDLPRGDGGGFTGAWTLNGYGFSNNNNNNKQNGDAISGSSSHHHLANLLSANASIIEQNMFNWATDLPRANDGGFIGAWTLNGYGFSNNEHNGDAIRSSSSNTNLVNLLSGNASIIEQNMFNWATELPRANDGGFIGAWTLNGFGFSNNEHNGDAISGSSSSNTNLANLLSTNASIVKQNMFNWATDLPRANDGGFTGAWTLNGYGFSNTDTSLHGTSALDRLILSNLLSSNASMIKQNMFNWATDLPRANDGGFTGAWTLNGYGFSDNEHNGDAISSSNLANLLSTNANIVKQNMFNWATDLPRADDGGFTGAWTLNGCGFSNTDLASPGTSAAIDRLILSNLLSSNASMIKQNMFNWATELPRGGNGGFTGAWTLNGYGFSDNEHNGDAISGSNLANLLSTNASIVKQNMFNWATDLPRADDGGFTGAWTLNGFGFSNDMTQTGAPDTSALDRLLLSNLLSSNATMIKQNMFNWATDFPRGEDGGFTGACTMVADSGSFSDAAAASDVSNFLSSNDSMIKQNMFNWATELPRGEDGGFTGANTLGDMGESFSDAAASRVSAADDSNVSINSPSSNMFTWASELPRRPDGGFTGGWALKTSASNSLDAAFGMSSTLDSKPQSIYQARQLYLSKKRGEAATGQLIAASSTTSSISSPRETDTINDSPPRRRRSKYVPTFASIMSATPGRGDTLRDLPVSSEKYSPVLAWTKDFLGRIDAVSAAATRTKANSKDDKMGKSESATDTARRVPLNEHPEKKRQAYFFSDYR